MACDVLITSISRKVTLLQGVKGAFYRLNGGRIIGSDINKNVIGKYFVNKFWLSKRIDDIEINEYIRYCKNNKIHERRH